MAEYVISISVSKDTDEIDASSTPTCMYEGANIRLQLHRGDANALMGKLL